MSCGLSASVPAAIAHASSAELATFTLWPRSLSVRSRRSPMTRPVVSLQAQKMPLTSPVSARMGLYEKVK
jgi:hypothetical protein